MEKFFPDTKYTLTVNDVKRYIDHYRIFKDYQVRELSAGLANRNFLVQTKEGQYNLRTNRLRPPMSKEYLLNEHIFLEFARKEQIPYVARSIYYDPGENIHIVKFIPGKKLQMKNMDRKNLESVIGYLFQTNALREKFSAYLKSRNIAFKPPRTHADILANIKENTNLLTDSDYREPVDWVLEKIRSDWSSLNIGEEAVFLVHGDPVSNVIINGKKIYLIDWERVKFSFDPGLAYIWLHGYLEDEKREYIVKAYSRISGLDYRALREQTVYKFKQLLIENIIGLCKVNWRNRKMFDPDVELDIDLIRGRIKYYDYIT